MLHRWPRETDASGLKRLPTHYKWIQRFVVSSDSWTRQLSAARKLSWSRAWFRENWSDLLVAWWALSLKFGAQRFCVLNSGTRICSPQTSVSRQRSWARNKPVLRCTFFRAATATGNLWGSIFSKCDRADIPVCPPRFPVGRNRRFFIYHWWIQV